MENINEMIELVFGYNGTTNAHGILVNAYINNSGEGILQMVVDGGAVYPFKKSKINKADRKAVAEQVNRFMAMKAEKARAAALAKAAELLKK